MITHKLLTLLGVLLLLVAPGFVMQGHAQAAAPAGKTEVLVLGTYHFANPGLDVVKVEVADVLSPAKQAEIRSIVEALARFRPTKIAVEQVPATAPRLDSAYRAYRASTHQLTRDETEQLGFRLAAMLEHPRLYPVDHRGEFPFGPLMQYAAANDTAFVSEVNREMARITAESNQQHRDLTIPQILRAANDPADLARGHAFYMRVAEVGAGDSYVGANLLARWYERNIHIFSNLQRVAEPGDRILLIIGSGHAPILRELVSADVRLTLVEANQFLPQ